MRRAALLAAAVAAIVVVACRDLTAPDAAPRPVAATPAQALLPAAMPVVVAPDDLHGWSFGTRATPSLGARACTDGALCHLVAGPPPTPLGTGSAELRSAPGHPATLALHPLAGTRLADLTALGFALRREPARRRDDASVTLSLSVDYDLTGARAGEMDRLTFVVPPEDGIPGAPAAWRPVDARAGLWWGAREHVHIGRREVRNPCREESPCRWAALLHHFPALGLRDSVGALVLRAAGGAAVQVDSVVIGTGARTTTYDFELALPVVEHPATESLTVFRDVGVLGTPAETDTTLAYGSAVAYDFQPPADGRTLSVTLDGVAVAPSGSMVMTRRHVLAAFAMRDLRLRPDDQPLLAAMQAVLQAGDPVPAFQALLDFLGRSYAEVGEDETAERLARAGAAAFDPVRDSSALRRVDEALGGHIFEINSPLAPMPSARGAMRVAPAPRISARSMASEPVAEIAGNGTADPTAIYYVNGIGNSYADAAASEARLGFLLRRDVWRFRDPVDVVIRMMYNRNDAAQNPRPGRLACLQAAVSNGLFSALPQYLACRSIGLLTPVTSILADAQEAASLMSGKPAPIGAPVMADIRTLFDSISASHRAGRNVVIMPHSEGNLITERALGQYAADSSYRPNGRPRCIAVAPMASPTVHYGPLPARYVAPVQLAGDVVLLTPRVVGGAETFPSIDNALNDRLTREREANTGTSSLRYLRQLLDGVKIHGMDSYLAPDGGQYQVESAAEQAYQACAASWFTFMGPADAASPWQYTMLLGTSAQYDVTPFNGAGDTIVGRRVTWRADGGMTSITPTGRVTAIAVGGPGFIAARMGAAEATFNISTWSEPPVIDAVSCTQTSRQVVDGGIITTWATSVDARPSDPLAPITTYRLQLEITRRWSNADQYSAVYFDHPNGSTGTTTSIVSESWLHDGTPEPGQWLPTGRCIGSVTDIYLKSATRTSP